MFAAAAELVAAHNGVLAALNKAVDPAGDPGWDLTEPMPMVTDPGEVHCCPHCVHDW